MNKIFSFLAILFLISVFNLNTQETKPAKVGKQYLIIIALNKYKNRLPLNDRVENAKEIKNLLYSKYEIDELIELYDFDATFLNINNILTELQKKIKKDDSLLLYYSGHGYIDEKINEVYWLPYDSGINEYLRNLWLSNNELIKSLNKINAKQIFVISDSCFNQNLLEPIVPEEKMKFTDQYFTDSYSKNSRQFLCSGELETGIEKTEFSQVLINTLRIIRNDYIDPVMIFENIKNKINKTVPYLGYSKDLGHQEYASTVLFKRQKEIAIKEIEEKKDEITKTEKTEKEKVIVVKKLTSFSNLHPINKSGRILMIVSVPVLVSGLSLFGVDMAYMLTELDDKIHNGNSYEEYVRTYRVHIVMFITSIVISSIGLTGVIVSIPLIAFKEGWFKNKNKVSLNLNVDLNCNFLLFLRYRL